MWSLWLGIIVIVTTNACRYATARACTQHYYITLIIERNLCISTTRTLAVTAPDICSMFCVVLHNLTLVLFKACLYRAIRSITLSSLSYNILLILQIDKLIQLHSIGPQPLVRCLLILISSPGVVKGQ